MHLGITKLKVQNYNPILFHILKNDPKLFQILEKLFLINFFSYSKIRSIKPPLYRPTKWSKTFNKGAKVVRIISNILKPLNKILLRFSGKTIN